MFNLVLKDILIQKRALIFLGLYIIIFIFAFQSIGSGAFTAITIAVTYQLVATACNHEEKANSDIVMNSLPLSRKEIVLSKYLSVIVYALMAILGYMVFSVILSLIPIPVNIPPITLENLVITLVGVIVMNSIYFPIYFKVGYVKARIISFILFFVFFFGAMSLLQAMTSSEYNVVLQKITGLFSGVTVNNILIILIGVALVLVLGSYALSVRFYTNREF